MIEAMEVKKTMKEDVKRLKKIAHYAQVTWIGLRNREELATEDNVAEGIAAMRRAHCVSLLTLKYS